MVLKRLEEASKLIDEALKESYADIAITNLLMKCKTISKLLDIDKENKWLEYEINGYPLASDSDGSTKQHKDLPSSRCQNLIASVADSTAGSGTSYYASKWRIYKPDFPLETTFWTTESCGFLERIQKNDC